MSKKTFRFISPKIQNEIVQIMALDILEKVKENVKKAKKFSILLGVWSFQLTKKKLMS